MISIGDEGKENKQKAAVYERCSKEKKHVTEIYKKNVKKGYREIILN